VPATKRTIKPIAPADPDRAAASEAGEPRPAFHPDDATLLDQFSRTYRAERSLSGYTIRNYLSDLTGFLMYLRSHGLDPSVADRASVRGYLGEQQERGTARGSLARKASAIRAVSLRKDRGLATEAQSG
jgi:integrase/recombinase XerC